MWSQHAQISEPCLQTRLDPELDLAFYFLIRFEAAGAAKRVSRPFSLCLVRLRVSFSQLEFGGYITLVRVRLATNPNRLLMPRLCGLLICEGILLGEWFHFVTLELRMIVSASRTWSLLCFFFFLTVGADIKSCGRFLELLVFLSSLGSHIVALNRFTRT